MWKKIFWLLIPVTGVLVVSLATSGIPGGDPQAGLFHQNIVHPLLPEKIDFAGEPLPLQYFDVREALQREIVVITYWHASMLYTLQLSRRFFPIIEPILEEEGVPDDFKYLCVAESNLQQAISPSKAVGFWQLLEGTAKEYGLEITEEIDERYHIEKATHAACAYLKKAYAKYGSWTMAAAAYNVGNTNLDKQIARQKQTGYYDLLLPEETSRYVFRAAGFKLVMSHPAAYGFNLRDEDLYQPLQWSEKQITGTVESWADFAGSYGTNYKIFKYFNAWLRDERLTNTARKTYVVKIPQKGFREATP